MFLGERIAKTPFQKIHRGSEAKAKSWKIWITPKKKIPSYIPRPEIMCNFPKQ